VIEAKGIRILRIILTLLEGEDDALVDGAAFQLAVGKGGLLHGHGCVRASTRCP
jgi:hypothetical protein